MFTAPTAGAWRFTLFGYAASSASGQSFQVALSTVNGTILYSSASGQFMTSILVQTLNLASGGQVTTQYSCSTAGLTGGTGTGGMFFTAELIGLVI